MRAPHLFLPSVWITRKSSTSCDDPPGEHERTSHILPVCCSLKGKKERKKKQPSSSIDLLLDILLKIKSSLSLFFRCCGCPLTAFDLNKLPPPPSFLSLLRRVNQESERASEREEKRELKDGIGEGEKRWGAR